MSSKIHKKAWVNVAVFDSPGNAQPLETFLNNRRIESRTYNDKLLQLILFLCPPHASFRVQVRANAFRATAELLHDSTEAAVLLEPALHCPSCSSLNINYPQMTRKFFLPTVLLHLGIIFRFIEHQCYCEDCHAMWNFSDKNAVRKVRDAKPFPF